MGLSEANQTELLVARINLRRKNAILGNRNKINPLKQISFKKVNNCIIANNKTLETGYVVTYIGSKRKGLHILIYEEKNGKIPIITDKKQKLFICHTCDTRNCININHLFLGTQKDNIRDCVYKNRNAFGLKQRCVKLNNEKVREIRKLYTLGTWVNCKYRDGQYFKREYTIKKLGKLFGVTYNAIYSIIHKITWKRVGEL